MKVCLISNVFSPERLMPAQKIGGAEVCVERIARQLKEDGHSVMIITQRPFSGLGSLFPLKELKSGYQIHSFYPLNLFSIYNAHRKSFLLKGLWRLIDLVNILPAITIKKIIEQEKPEIINNHIIHGFSPLMLIRAIKKTAVPFVQTIHSYGFICPRCDLMRHTGRVCTKLPLACALFKKISLISIGNKPDKVIFPSNFCRDLYKKYGFFNNGQSAVLYNPIETFPQRPDKPKGDTFTVFYAGRLTKIKGVHVLIQAFKELPHARARLLIAGEGYFEGALRKQAEADPRITFLGRASWEQLRSLYARSDILVIPSIYNEILGNVILESMSFGTPVLGSRIGGICEIIQDNLTGLLVRPNSSRDLGAALKWCMEHPDELRRMGEAAFERSKEFDIKKHARELEGTYRRLISSSS